MPHAAEPREDRIVKQITKSRVSTIAHMEGDAGIKHQRCELSHTHTHKPGLASYSTHTQIGWWWWGGDLWGFYTDSLPWPVVFELALFESINIK
jgi:hypothetical protein